MLRIGRIVLLAAAPAMLGGCDANQLYLAYQTNLGINAAINPETNSGHLMVGYNRDFAAVVPKSVPVKDRPNERDAMAALVCSDLVVDGIFLKKYSESVATGQAAILFAKALRDGKNQSDDFFDCYKRAAPTTGEGTK